MFSVYILYSKILNKYYIGFTGETVETRLAKHLILHRGFTAKAKDWVIKRVEIYEDKTTAMDREREIKTWKSRIKIEKFIRSSIK